MKVDFPDVDMQLLVLGATCLLRDTGSNENQSYFFWFLEALLSTE